jgi:hypothetical protein
MGSFGLHQIGIGRGSALRRLAGPRQSLSQGLCDEVLIALRSQGRIELRCQPLRLFAQVLQRSPPRLYLFSLQRVRARQPVGHGGHQLDGGFRLGYAAARTIEPHSGPCVCPLRLPTHAGFLRQLGRARHGLQVALTGGQLLRQGIAAGAGRVGTLQQRFGIGQRLRQAVRRRHARGLQ